MKSRREFLKHSAATGALITTPYIWTSQYARAQDLNSKPTVAAIGVGGSRGRFNQGGAIARKAAQQENFVGDDQANALMARKSREVAFAATYISLAKPKGQFSRCPSNHFQISLYSATIPGQYVCPPPGSTISFTGRSSSSYFA